MMFLKNHESEVVLEKDDEINLNGEYKNQQFLED
jgi:hypothetical protein